MIESSTAAESEPPLTSSPITDANFLVPPSDGSIYLLVRKQQAEIETLRQQAEEAVRLRAELEKLRAEALSA